MEKDLISVIVPIYNVAAFLPKCIDSIMNQTYSVLEIILVDDGSKDDSGKICDEYKKRDPRIKIIHHKSNLGTVRARKSGFLNSSGSIITFLDGDDWIEPIMYEELYSTMKKHEVDIVTSTFIMESGSNSYISENKLSEGIYGLEVKRDVFAKHIFKSFSTSANNKIFKREIVAQYMMDVDDQIYGCHDDTAWVIPALLEANNFYNKNSSYYHYRIHRNSVTHRYSPLWLQKLNLVILHLINCSEKYNWSEEIKEMLNYFINSSIIDGISHISDKVLFPQYYVDINETVFGKKIVLYGAGKVGRSLYQFFKKTKLCEIVLWVDKKSDLYEEVKDIKLIKETDFDLILIAVLNKSMAMDIKQSLTEYEDRCIWVEPQNIIDYYDELN
ncbi:MAG: glycosyltransferase family 2 protein [Hungatella sp.]|nr:glycosyltransferase family 2 protein [Hungatella sp.]